MTMKLMRRAVKLFSSPYVSRATNKHNRAAWLRAVQLLGDKWVLQGGEARWGHGSSDGRAL